MSGNPLVSLPPLLLMSGLIIDPQLELGRMLLFTHGIDLAKDIARNCGVTADVEWAENTVTMTSQDPDLIAKAVQRFNKLEEFYVPPPFCLYPLCTGVDCRIVLGCRLCIFKR
jgi:hypothetical protein